MISNAISLMIAVPLIGALLTFLTRNRSQARLVSLIASLVPLVLALQMYMEFDKSSKIMQFVESYDWVPSLGVKYTVGVDGIGFPLVLLSAIVTVLVIIYSWGENKRPNEYFALLLLNEVGVMGVFTALDFFLFYIFWEIVLIPMFFLIGVWGGPRKDYAAIKFFIYTHVASLVMLLAIFALYFTYTLPDGSRTFDMLTLLQATSDKTLFPPALLNVIFAGLLLGFLVKMPAFPFHTWLPDAHVEAPTAGSVVLAALLLKMGGYGLFRVIMPMLPNVDSAFVTLIAIIGVVSIIYGAFLALAQKDIKKLVAYSSISHMGFVTLGSVAAIGAMAPFLSLQGAMFQQFSHGIITCALFMSAGTIQHTVGTRIIADLGGLADRMPRFAFLMVAAFLASLGLPGMSGFVAEFLVLTGSYQTMPTLTIIVILLSVVVTAGYHLWAVQKVLFGPILQKYLHLHDAHNYELVAMSGIIVLSLIFGLQPALITDIMQTASYQLMEPVKTLAQMGVI
ncbi:MAG: F(420)H(2) dehydrogenase subunit M [Methanosaeta sp. PtaB.Bin039]|nr:MAG: F(420)H(2) dehydrogenase subunit M [Methanosaeta sp. PtaB.Bin039]OPY45222.1 MAG: F(420)H(2) dehydrogenase subunit M [Methanosaeta sp. PtaU1.Bin028]HQF16610.1 NADH-quinone oxidoreductase subunit M [Methanotrichaceae archaeon]HQI91242.1 NADH-quinone oxidoreductase subunit M [Methanotrichaceae archaeon]HQJ61710.1 NADH-quinone oxidoreductase subunit M [Methanothrix soehngenii]